MDPAILSAIAANPSAYPGSPANPVATGGPGGDAAAAPPPAEPVALHDAAVAACDELNEALERVQELAGMAQEADNIDPAVEKKLSDAAEKLAAIKETLDECVEDLGEAREEHEEMVAGAKDDAPSF